MNTICDSSPSVDEVMLASRNVGDELLETELCIPEMNCGACINKLEKKLSALESVYQVRANLSKKRICLQWYAAQSPQEFISSVKQLGYSATLVDSNYGGRQSNINTSLRALAVSGFAAGNIMLLSIAVWSGADESTRQLFHWVSAAIALPAILYSAKVFFKSAWKAVRVGTTNMDVPVSIGIILSMLLGLYDTVNHNERVYFEAATMLVFFLLIGRTLDTLMRTRAAVAVDELRSLEPSGAYAVEESGKLKYKATKDLVPGESILVKPGYRIPVDGTVMSGESSIDTAIVDGESRLKTFESGQCVHGGTLNVTADLLIKVTANADNSFLAQMQRLVEFAHSDKGVYTQTADRAARWYAPLVHSAAALAFILWFYLSGDIHRSLTVAISVLIITCPCALALAVPMVHVIAGSQLLKRGIIMKNGAALEKLAEIGNVVFDKTGTLTSNTPSLAASSSYTEEHLALAQKLVQQSEHPYVKALMAIKPLSILDGSVSNLDVKDTPGCGLEAVIESKRVRLGKRSWAAHLDTDNIFENQANESETVLTCGGKVLAVFRFDNKLRVGAVAALNRLRKRSIHIAIVSGDRTTPVMSTANQLEISDVHASAMPAEKVAIIKQLSEKKPVLMVGDGLNDSGAMAVAHVAIAPGTAATIGRNIADFVFLREDLESIPDAIDMAHEAKRIIKQNITLAVLYNLVVLPVAFAGFVSPLIAAVAMSLSSILVVANAMRLRLHGYPKTLGKSATQPVYDNRGLESI